MSPWLATIRENEEAIVRMRTAVELSGTCPAPLRFGIHMATEWNSPAEPFGLEPSRAEPEKTPQGLGLAPACTCACPVSPLSLRQRRKRGRQD